MSENNHDAGEHGIKKIANPNYKVPLALPIIAILVLAAMWIYADRWDPNPEITVTRYFKAMNARQYDVAADQLSVFQVVTACPEYMELSPHELVNKRSEIIPKVSQMMTEANPDAMNVKITIEPSYTLVGDYAALVVFNQEEEGQPKLLTTSLLIKEAGRFRIYDAAPLSPQGIETFSKNQFKEFDSSLRTLLEEATSTN